MFEMEVMVDESIRTCNESGKRDWGKYIYIYIYYRRTNYLEKWISKLREISQDGNGSRGFNKINGGM